MNTLPKLISVDVGGTLGRVIGQSVADVLVARSSLPRNRARGLIRRRLLTAREVSVGLRRALCEELRLPQDAFPEKGSTVSLKPYLWSREALLTLGRIAPVVTLSNISCLDLPAASEDHQFADLVVSRYRSCQIGYSKPDPDAFGTVAVLHRVNVHEMLHIGDSWECDVIGALSVGARAVWISPDTEPPTSLPENLAGRLIIVKDLRRACEQLSEAAVRLGGALER